MERKSARPKLLVTLTGGGFLFEALSLIRRLGDDYDYCFISTDDSLTPQELSGAEIYFVRSFAVLGEPHLRQRIPAFFKAFLQTYRALARAKPDFVIVVGASLAIPIGIVARLKRIPFVFIESIARIERPSVTAKLVMRLRLADRLYVQWPDAVHLYSGGIYRGTVV